MAKRIKIKGKAPRGLSKYERQYNYAYKSRGGLGGGRREGNREMMYTVKRVNRDGTVEPHDSPIADKNAMSRPSSTRKKRVKEGDRKFIGPRSLKSEIAEDAATRFRESFGPDRTGDETPAYVMRNVGKKGNLPRISRPKKQKTASGADSRIKALIALKRLSESGQLPGEVGRMLRDIPGI